jgi:hypothetical protein
MRAALREQAAREKSENKQRARERRTSSAREEARPSSAREEARPVLTPSGNCVWSAFLWACTTCASVTRDNQQQVTEVTTGAQLRMEQRRVHMMQALALSVHMMQALALSGPVPVAADFQLFILNTSHFLAAHHLEANEVIVSTVKVAIEAMPAAHFHQPNRMHVTLQAQ